MAKAKKLPSGNWRCRATITDSDGNKVTMSFTAETAKKAEALAKMWQAGMIEKKRERETGGVTLGEAIDRYIETCRCAKMSPATLRGYISVRRNAFKLIENKPIRKLTVLDIQDQLNARSKTCSPKTIRNDLGLLTASLKQYSIKIDVDSLTIPKKEMKEMEIPSDAQVCEMLNAAYDDDDLYLAVLLSSMMGLRRSEICALKWSDITHTSKGSFISITKALVPDENGKLVVKGPKSDAGYRTLNAPKAIADQLKMRRQISESVVSASPDILTKRFNAMCRKLGFDFHFHTLRHYHASVMLREGVPQKNIVKDMGHATFEMVRRVYGHIMQENKVYIDRRMDSHASSMMEKVDAKIATASK